MEAPEGHLREEGHRDPTDDPANYLLGAFYHNHGDPALMVPMRHGNGVDFNYARWPGRALVLLLILGLLYALVTACG